MKDSKEKEHRISNLKDMINNVKTDGKEVQSTLDLYDYNDELEEDSELIDYLNEDKVDFDEFEIDDEFIYHPGDEGDYAIDLEENPIDEDFMIKTEIPDENGEEYNEIPETEEIIGDFGDEMESFDNLVNAKIGKTPILAIVSAVLGILLIIASIFVFNSRSDRIIDNVVSGETNFIVVVLLIFGLLLLIYGIYHIFSIKNPFENITNSLESIEKGEDVKNKPNLAKPDATQEKVIPKSNIPLDKESYKIGEFNMDDIKNGLKKPTSSKKPVKKDLDDIPPAKKSDFKKDLTEEEIQEIEHDQTILDNESIDEIFAGVEDIDEMPIIGIDSNDEKNE